MAETKSNEDCKQYCMEDVKKHVDSKSAWFVIHNSIYDVTAFLNEWVTNTISTVSSNEVRHLLRIGEGGEPLQTNLRIANFD